MIKLTSPLMMVVSFGCIDSISTSPMSAFPVDLNVGGGKSTA